MDAPPGRQESNTWITPGVTYDHFFSKGLKSIKTKEDRVTKHNASKEIKISEYSFLKHINNDEVIK